MNHSVLLRALCVSVVLLFSFSLSAQQRAMDTIQVNVITTYKPVINDASKINSNPAIADTVKIVKNVQYNMLSSQFPTTYTPQQISPITLKPEPEEQLYHSLLNLGGGNYNTLYGEYFFNSLRSDGNDYGIHLNHLSSQATLNNYGFSGFSFNDVNLYGKTSFGEHSLYAQADFDNHVVHDYGYNINEDQVSNNTTRESYDLFGGFVRLKSEYRDSSKINHELKIGDDYFEDIYNSTENNFNGEFKFFTCFNRLRIDLDGMADFYSDDNLIPINFNYSANDMATKTNPFSNSNLLLNPFFTTAETHWDAHIGLNAYYAPALFGINVFPDVLLRFHVAQDILMFFAGVDGKQTFDSYKSLADQNPYIQDTLNLKYTQVQYHVYGGIAGNITSQLSYNINAAQSQIKNMPLFITDTLEPLRNRFTVVYDNVKELNIHGDLDYKTGSVFSLALAGDYFSYTPTTQIKVWYHPGVKISLDGKYAISEKFTLRADLFYLGSQYAPDMLDGIMTAKTLSGYPDLNLGLDYKFNRIFTAFINLNNLANITYYQWDNYPLQKFNVLGGIRFGF